jgi:hypothetical protein
MSSATPMKQHKRAAIISTLTDELHAQGSWTGETHLQKGVYLLQEMLGVPMDVEFVLFKHGPFSFQLREELGDLRSQQVLNLVSQRRPYGPRFYSDEGAEQLRERFPNAIKKYQPQMQWLAEQMGDRGVVDLEKLATAFWVTQELGDDASVDDRAARLNELKPHFDLPTCVAAVRKIDELRREAPVVPTA